MMTTKLKQHTFSVLSSMQNGVKKINQRLGICSHVPECSNASGTFFYQKNILLLESEQSARAVLERFVHVCRSDGLGTGKVGDGARDAHGAVIASRREVEALGGACQRFFRGSREAAFLIELATRKRGIRRARLADAVLGARAGGDDAFSHFFRRLAL